MQVYIYIIIVTYSQLRCIYRFESNWHLKRESFMYDVIAFHTAPRNLPYYTKEDLLNSYCSGEAAGGRG